MRKIDETFGFLKRLYRGYFDLDLFSMDVSVEPSARVRKITSAYDAILKDYPPSELEAKGELPRELILKLGEIGIFGLLVPEKYGGLGLSVSEYLNVVDHMAASDMAVAITPLAHISIGIKGILLFGNESQKEKYLPRAATGEAIFAYALTEPRFGSDAKAIETKATLSEDGKHYVLSGQKTYITNGNYASGFTVFAQLDPEKPGNMGAFIVERSMYGVHVGPNMKKMGLIASSTTMVRFDGVLVPKENLLGSPGDGFKIAMTILNYGRLGLGAASCGVMRQAISDMLNRADSRVQFGSRISSFELIQEKIAKARARLFAVTNLTYFTAKLLERSPLSNAAEESSHCKLYATTSGWDTLYDALQVAGGAGYLSNLPYEKRMRDFRVTTVFEGTTEIHSIYPALFLAREIGKELAAMHPVKRLIAIARGYIHKPRIRVKASLPIICRGLAIAASNLRSVARKALRAAVKYRGSITGREYMARRLTLASLDAYIIIACAAYIEQEKRNSKDVRQAVRLFAYLLDEAKERAHSNGHFEVSFRERESSEIMHDLRNEHVPS